jgi:hypothetical protein
MCKIWDEYFLKSFEFPHVSGICSTQTQVEVFKECIKLGVYTPSMKNIFTQNKHYMQNMG